MRKPGIGNTPSTAFTGQVSQGETKQAQAPKAKVPTPIRDKIDNLPTKGLVGKSSPLEGLVSSSLERRIAMMGYEGQQSAFGLRVDMMMPGVVGQAAPKVDLRVRRAMKKWLKALKGLRAIGEDDEELEEDANELAELYSLMLME